MANIKDMKIACVATDGFEWSELTEPKKALEEAGATVHVISLKEGKIKGMNHDDVAAEVEVDKVIADVDADDYDALLLPGGVKNPDTLRTEDNVVDFVRTFADADKPIAAICHGPWTLINAEAVEGKKMTSWPSLQKDLENAGALWEDSEVVVDGNLVTSRKPDDIPAFNREFINILSK